ncbi:uncharacterized protein LOC143822608 isoform X1 [Paroedura picta]|uniref:uncharacterized protein LOC143822608 isoform X1 n=1 Tax=Paroedura picta TaxID=143630 RepID=UPI004055C80A
MGGRWPVLIEVSCRGGGGRKGGEKRGCRRAMAKAAGLGVGLLLLLLLVLLRGASLEWPPGGPCCAWRAESVEWPVGASQCPAEGTRPDANANASYCCGLCFSGEAQEDDEGAWPDGDAACPPARHEDWTPLRSAASPEPGSLASALDLIVPGVFLLLFFCAWLWLRDQDEGRSSFSGPPLGRPSSSLVLSWDLPPAYGACSRSAVPPLARSPQDSPGLPGEPPVEGIISSPLGVLGAPPEEEVGTGAPPEEAALPAEHPRSPRWLEG